MGRYGEIDLLGRVDSARHHRLESDDDVRLVPYLQSTESSVGSVPWVVGDDVRRRQHRIDGHVRLRAVAALARHLTTPPTRGTSRRSGGFGYRGGRGGWALGVGGGRAGEVARSLPHHPKTEPTPDSRLWRCGTRRHQCCLQVYLPISPHLSPSLPISPHLSLGCCCLQVYLPISPHISLGCCCLQVYLPISTHSSPSLPISPHISPRS